MQFLSEKRLNAYQIFGRFGLKNQIRTEFQFFAHPYLVVVFYAIFANFTTFLRTNNSVMLSLDKH